MILYRLRPDDSFLCGDTASGLTAYAYPTSTHAIHARRRPVSVALAMLRDEPRRDTLSDRLRAEIEARDRAWMVELCQIGTGAVPSCRTDAFADGWRAYEAGLAPGANPHERNPERYDWRAGYDERHHVAQSQIHLQPTA